MHWSWTYRKNLKKERIQCNVFFLVKTLIVTLSSLFPKVILGYYICKGRGNYAPTKTSLQFKQQYNYHIMTKFLNNYTRMTACHAPTTFINKVQFSKNGNWLRSWLTLTKNCKQLIEVSLMLVSFITVAFNKGWVMLASHCCDPAPTWPILKLEPKF